MTRKELKREVAIVAARRPMKNRTGRCSHCKKEVLDRHHRQTCRRMHNGRMF